MIADQTYSCTECGKSAKVRGGLSTLLVCVHCGSIIQNDTGIQLSKKQVPDDYGPIQLGTTGTYKGHTFEVIGLIHLQFRRDYRKFWCLWLNHDRTYAWLVESLGSFVYCKDSFFEIGGSTPLQVGKSVDLVKMAKVKFDFTDQCDVVSYAGETTGWLDFIPSFKVAQAITSPNIVAFFLRSPRKERIRFLLGERVTFESLHLQRIREWSELNVPKGLPTVQCPNCNKIQVPRGRSLTTAMTCIQCDRYFGTRPWANTFTSFKAEGAPSIPIGTKGKINGITYEVMGYLLKHVTRHNYNYSEYNLYNPTKGIAYLSEYEGNWNFLVPLYSDPRNSESIKVQFQFEGREFRIYQKYWAGVIYGKGEFFSDVFSISPDVACEEYISPPKMVGIEADHNSRRWFQGEYKSPQEIASAFNVKSSSLPKKNGRGYTQPFVASFDQLALIRVCLALVLLIIGLQVFFEMNDQEKVVFQNTFHITDLKEDQKMFVTSSFDIEGESKSLIVDFYAPVKNDWFYGDFTLINENDQSEYNFSHEIEYYAGYEDGESWSEGSQRGESYLSKIPGGRYHINIYPQFSPNTFEFSISVTRDVSPFSNMWITFVLIGIFPAFYLIRRYYVERSRWSESDFSPYDED